MNDLCENLADKGVGYGMESHIIDGNNILEVFEEFNRNSEFNTEKTTSNFNRI